MNNLQLFLIGYALWIGWRTDGTEIGATTGHGEEVVENAWKAVLVNKQISNVAQAVFLKERWPQIMKV